MNPLLWTEALQISRDFYPSCLLCWLRSETNILSKSQFQISIAEGVRKHSNHVPPKTYFTVDSLTLLYRTCRMSEYKCVVASNWKLAKLHYGTFSLLPLHKNREKITQAKKKKKKITSWDKGSLITWKKKNPTKRNQATVWDEDNLIKEEEGRRKKKKANAVWKQMEKTIILYFLSASVAWLQLGN